MIYTRKGIDEFCKYPHKDKQDILCNAFHALLDSTSYQDNLLGQYVGDLLDSGEYKTRVRYLNGEFVNLDYMFSCRVIGNIHGEDVWD